MITKTRLALTAAVAAAMVAVPTAAQAADWERYSTTGRSYIAYDSSSGQITLCDRVNGDGIGARVTLNDSTSPNSWYFIEYNGCSTGPAFASGYATMEICDWMVNRNGQRYAGNCRSWSGWV